MRLPDVSFPGKTTIFSIEPLARNSSAKKLRQRAKQRDKDKNKPEETKA